MINVSVTQFHVFLSWGQCPFSTIVQPFYSSSPGELLHGVGGLELRVLEQEDLAVLRGHQHVPRREPAVRVAHQLVAFQKTEGFQNT